ncbi:hypothetical protein DT304_00350 [Lactobacillus reuteri]|uniref:hypothetical protein n=1 Tax=Limosilactobacillus reuteri TaxID=1598 RepID=UPI0016527D76|nr:hypothetical protein [Limosilactobacillus reuteri]MBC6909788.1 hypothetical protein [Limosilactobacillus reuteri]
MKIIEEKIKQQQYLLEEYDHKTFYKYYSYEKYKDNSPLEFLKLSKIKQEELIEYCLKAFQLQKTANNNWNSNSLKRLFEIDTPNGFPITNGQFKGAMLISGFIPVNCYCADWVYRISENSVGLIDRSKF